MVDRPREEKPKKASKRRRVQASEALLWALVGLLAVWLAIVPIGLGAWWMLVKQPSISAADLATLMRTFPGLWWPMLLVVALVLFRTDLAAALRRLRRWSGWGNTVELDPERVEDLEEDVKEAAAEESAKPPPPPTAEGPPPPAASSVDANELYELASRDYRLAVARLAMAIEASLTDIAKQLGMEDRQPVRVIWRMLAQLGLVSSAMLSSLTSFWSVRNEVIHGRNVELSREAIAGLLDSGLTLLGIVRTIPSRMFTVVNVVDVYLDPDGGYPIDDVKGVILRSGGENPQESGPFPTTRLYKSGARVSWAWNLDRRFHAMWYRDAAGQIRPAWDESFEFVGTELTLQWNRKWHPGLEPPDRTD